MIDLKGNPFFLSDEDAAWVKDTLASMSDREKIGQLFVPLGSGSDDYENEDLLLSRGIGGILYRSDRAEKIAAKHAYLQSRSRIPLLIAANLETGGCGTVKEGTFAARQMQIAASTRPEEYARDLGSICGKEGAAVLCNWSFAPVCDIDFNWRNPITNVRTYGSELETVRNCTLAYRDGLEKEPMICSVKHFPGDGVDEVDQHILTSINTLSADEWDKTYGSIYASHINSGVVSVMAGHIALPSWHEKLGGDVKDKFLPCTLNPVLLKGLLRGKLGFNGLIVTDSTCMVGFTAAMSREKAVPYSIESGCDMFLFNKDFEEDYAFMCKGLDSGLLSRGRLDDAVTRILAAKAHLGLHRVQDSKADLSVPGKEAHRAIARNIARDSVTLVKDEKNLLPFTPQKYRRVLLQLFSNNANGEAVCEMMREGLVREGFEVSVYRAEEDKDGPFDTESFKEKYDAVLYLADIENMSNKVTNRLSWVLFGGNGNNVPWFVNDVPTILISFANPYHLIDMPMIGTFINCYAGRRETVDAVIGCMSGKQPFRGHSPVDPFLGKEWLKARV